MTLTVGVARPTWIVVVAWTVLKSVVSVGVNVTDSVRTPAPSSAPVAGENR